MFGVLERGVWDTTPGSCASPLGLAADLAADLTGADLAAAGVAAAEAVAAGTVPASSVTAPTIRAMARREDIEGNPSWLYTDPAATIACTCGWYPLHSVTPQQCPAMTPLLNQFKSNRG